MAARHLSLIARYINELLLRAGHPRAGWNHHRTVFLHRLILGLVMAGDTMLTAIVRHFPNRGVAMRHRYKTADRMLGEVDLVEVAAQQTEVLGRELDERWIIALDLSDITKRYATKMECMAQVYDGSEKRVSAPGFGLISATAIDPSSGHKGMPVPLLFELYSSAAEDFNSETTIWLDGIDALCDATPAGTIVIDRGADNKRIFHRLMDRQRDFVVRVMCGDNSRHLLLHDDSRARVRDAWKEATFYGELECTRLSDDGTRKPYKADYGSLPVRLPGRRQQLWLCVFDSPDHIQPLVLLTSHRADTPEATARILTAYFARWVGEELHRFAKQAFHLENVRLLTWRRVKNMVAAVWIAMGGLCRLGLGPQAEAALRCLEARGDRVRRPLRDGQFHGYAMVEGLRAMLRDARNLPHLLPWLTTRRTPTPQLALFGGRA